MKNTKRQSPYVLYGIAALSLVSVVAALLWWMEIPALVAGLAAVNVTTLLFYGYDKVVAGFWVLRVPELILHSLALVGGSPAALLAQRLFRHKTCKRPFQRTFWTIVVVQVLIVLCVMVWGDRLLPVLALQ